MTEVARTRIRASIPPHTESGIHPAGIIVKRALRLRPTLNLRGCLSRILFSDSIIVGGVGSVVERRSLAGVLSLSCARPAADG